MVSSIGSQLTTLKIETVLTDIPLHLVGQNCSNLVELQIINSRVTPGRNHDCDRAAPHFFAKLKLLYLFLVHYVLPTDTHRLGNDSEPESSDSEAEELPDIRQGGSTPKTALHCVLRHALCLEGIQATGSPLFDDGSLKALVEVNPLRLLKRFIMTDAAVLEPSGLPLPLTGESVLRLYENCSQLQCIGDLRHWDISPGQRRALSKTIQERSGVKWISTPHH